VRPDGGNGRIKAALFAPSLLSAPALSGKHPDRCFTTQEVFPRHFVIDKSFLFHGEYMTKDFVSQEHYTTRDPAETYNQQLHRTFR
jgi:hypothetical protein